VIEAHRACSILGLIIDEAIYGVLESVGEKVESEVEHRFVDVTRASLFVHLF